MLPRNSNNNNISIASNKQSTIKRLSKNIKSEFWKLYIFFLVVLFILFEIITKLNKWTSFEPLIVFIAYSAIALIFLYYILNSILLSSLLSSMFIRLKGLNSIVNWILHHLILVTILYTYFFRRVSTSSIFIIATLIILGI
ncbi:hypothetical protein, partial [Priestia megaterium]|uniref:hypothetical protein n=1 Tax=Priestia megaterium TaxID=1404 RepID=UPI002FFDDDEB